MTTDGLPIDSPQPPQAARVRLRTLIALVMLLVASLGAGIAGWTAIKQQVSTNLERRLAQAQMMEIADRLQLIDFSRTGKAMQERLDRHQADARGYARLASDLRGYDAERARLADLDVQEALLKANAVRPFVEALPNLIGHDLTPDERRIGLVAVGSLQRRGMLASYREAGQAAADSVAAGGRIHFEERTRVETQDEQVLTLSLLVVALVLTLALLTFADLSGERVRLAQGMLVIACLIAAAAVALAIRTDHDLVLVVGGVIAAFALLVLVSWAAGWLRAKSSADGPLLPQSIDMQGFAGGQLQLQEAQRRFHRLLIGAISLAALASSVIGYWYVEASSRSDDAAYEAYQQQLDFVKRSGRASVAVLGTYDGLVDLYERRAACQSTRNRAALAVAGHVSLPAPVAGSLQNAVCSRLETDGEARSRDQKLAELDRLYGPDADPAFPQRLQHHVTAGRQEQIAAEALALWDGYAELTAFWSAKNTSYLAALTSIAIALYLFGQSMGMGQLRVTRAMAACGAIIAATASGAAVWDWSRTFPHGEATSVAACEGGDKPWEGEAAASPVTWLKAAARFYAQGSQQLSGAIGEADYAGAIKALECAVAVRPSLSLAHHELAGAKAISQSAHKGQSYYSLPSKERLEEIERNARATVEIQERLAQVPSGYALNGHAVALWALGIRDGKVGEIARALALVERAVGIVERLEADRLRLAADAPQNLYPWFSVLPLLYLNQGLFLIAIDRIEEGRAAIEKGLGLKVARDWTLASTMVTATSLLDSACDRLHSAERCKAIRAAVESYRQALVTGAWPGTEKVEPTSGLRAVMSTSSSSVALGVRIEGYDPARQRLDVVWSVKDPQWAVADALSAVSPHIGRGETRVTGGRDVIFQRNVLSASGYRRCLSTATYSADVYLDGRLVATASSTREGQPLLARRLGMLNIALCHPESWQLRETAGARSTGAATAVSMANARGELVALIASVPMPRVDDKDDAAIKAYAVERALGLLAAGGSVKGDTKALMSRLVNCDKAGEGNIAYGTVIARAGTVHVVLLIGAALDGANACEIMRSVNVMHGIPG